MPSTLELCQKFYGTNDVYKLFEVKKDAPEKEIKKAYYRLSLKVHPDRVEDEDKKECTEKFKVLSKIYSVLSDPGKRALYNEKGIIDEDDDDSLCNMMAMWQTFFKPISTEDISNFEKNYVGSMLERTDVKKAYLNGKGCINYMMNSIPFMKCEDEPRIAAIVQQMISEGDVPEYKIFTEEPNAKRNRRHKKYAKEAQEASAIKEELAKTENGNVSLEQQIMLRQTQREQRFTSLLDRLAEKYGDGDDEMFDLDEYVAKKKSKARATPPRKSAQMKKRKVQEGRISKKKD
ncbi:J domain-containing protein CG6693 [Toxorhynchites rutilus septentrionalis]|uniref:J domain-containing protein CG6693 n=1 Tax=Toxorhynchites rutilus septentrionalis TaxID=329112 RepID=UPI0024797BBB|nr:J domain-containing protein CG6693 [Toxorhynchites rutilus septentrionalis]